jgi:hypothetical protein
MERDVGRMETELSADASSLDTSRSRPIVAADRREQPRLGERSRLLTTMAVMVAAADEGRDYLGFFAPLVADCLKAWPSAKPVEPHMLARSLRKRWGFPTMPTAVAQLLMQRALKEGLLTRVERVTYPDYERLAEVPDLAEKREEMLAGMNALADAVCTYARDVHDLHWTQADADRALERLTDRFGAELATARRDGSLPAAAAGGDEALRVVYAFALRALERDPSNFDRLVEMVKATMIANVLFFQDARKLPRRLPELRAYLDTTPVLHALGFAPEEVQAAALEMLKLMSAFKIPTLVFHHTLMEISGVLENVAELLRRGTGASKQRAELQGRQRDTMDAIVKQGLTAGQVEALVARLDGRLRELGIGVCETPGHRQHDHIDEDALAKVVSESVNYHSKTPLEKDVDSLAAVDRLRAGAHPRDLADTRALFVTANRALAAASRRYFQSIKRDAKVPHCMTDTQITAHLWVRSDEREPNLPRRLLIAECYSANAPTPAVWERWVAHIVKLRERGDVSAEQVQTLIYHQQVRNLLFEVSRGDPQRIDDAAVSEVLERFEAQVRRPTEEAAELERLEAERRHEELCAEVAELRTQLAGQEQRAQAERDAHSTARQRAAELRRRTVGLSVAVLIALAFAVLCIIGEVDGRFWWASGVTALLMTCSALVTWGMRWPRRTTGTVLFASAALIGVWVGVFDVAGATQRSQPVHSSRKGHIAAR